MDDYSLYTVFSGILDKLWVLWELILLGEPIVVMTNSPDVCSSAVLNLISLVRPVSGYSILCLTYQLHYMGDFRPYFTIHDPEFHKFSEMFKNISYGVRNIFKRCLTMLDTWTTVALQGTGNCPRCHEPSIQERV